ncbi:hypothetical protein JIN85_00335 [Luteolibacter pohnpeiensis]|uniref:Uncharacterized protein n=1 Tax=Luteolibacter pohnpeiensis TaxID=454153 RepID=A0A934VPC0_9BACT|nr:hypothetical protein [Luteolibacter pohnpeiensis]MBK1880836.1 hypothetical protein [Luteolibacter pohnpeiensis]
MQSLKVTSKFHIHPSDRHESIQLIPFGDLPAGMSIERSIIVLQGPSKATAPREAMDLPSYQSWLRRIRDEGWQAQEVRY